MYQLRSFQRGAAIIMVAISSLLIFNACNASKRTKGAIIGGAVGAATGAIASKKNKAVSIILGASIGGIAGGLIGDYMDRQAEEIRKDLEGARVERVDEGIVVTFESGLLFDFDEFSLKPETRENLYRLSNTLQKYSETDVHILGHTDNIGNPSYNLTLSQNRAEAVRNYLVVSNVSQKRLEIQGFGESDPIATNDTKTGRQNNRRVEITIVASDKLIRDAKRGDIPGV